MPNSSNAFHAVLEDLEEGKWKWYYVKKLRWCMVWFLKLYGVKQFKMSY